MTSARGLLEAVAIALAVLTNAAVAQPNFSRPSTVNSPRLGRLQRAVAGGDTHALSVFWDEVRHQGAPLIEPTIVGDERLVTFLWQSQHDTHVVVMTDFGDYVPHMTLERLPSTDVWYRSIALPADARFLYELCVDDPAYPFVSGDTVRYPSATRPDPLNPRRWEFAKPHMMSLVELLGAPSLALSDHEPGVPRGVVGRFEKKLKSEILGNERDIFVATLAEGTGQSLDWWKRDWLDRGGVPEITWHATITPDSGGYRVAVSIRQTGALYHLPLEIGIESATGLRVERVQLDAATDDFRFWSASTPARLRIDPHRWLLAKITAQ